MTKIKYSIFLAALVILVPALAGANALDVNASAALTGSVGTACGGSPCGLEVQMSDQDQAYVSSTHPDSEAHVVITFRIDPNDLTLPPFDSPERPGRVRVLRAYNESGTARQHMFVTLKRNKTNTDYHVAVLQRNNGGFFSFVGDFWIGNREREIKIDWTAGNPGTVVVYRDGTELRRSEIINFDTKNVGEVRMGAVGGDPEAITPGVAGSYYLDEYVSTR